MDEATISDRTDADALSDGDHFLVRQPGATTPKTRKVAYADLKTQITAGLGGGGGGGPFTDLVLRAATPATDAYLEKDLGVNYTDIWASCQVGFDATYLPVAGGDFFDLMSGGSAFAGPYITGGNWNSENGGAAAGATPTDVWFLIELHYHAGITDFYLEGSLLFSYNSGTTNNIRVVRFGQWGATNDPAAIVFIKDIKVGTTRGATDLFFDDFATGDFSKWDSSTGDISLAVNDPFAGGGAGDVVGPGSATDNDFAQFDTTTGKLVKDGGLALDTDGTLAADSDSKIPSQKAVKAYVDDSVHAGVTKLDLGAATVFAPWCNDGTVIVALAQAAPVTAGTNLYADPADIVPGGVFMIRSDDPSDERQVFWMTRNPALVIPVMYLGFQVKFDATEIAVGTGGYVVRMSGSSLGALGPRIRYNSALLGGSWVWAIGGSSDLYTAPIIAGTFVTIDFKIETGAGGITITPRFDGVAGSPVTNPDFTTSPNQLQLGAAESTGSLQDRTFDNVTLGTTTWGSTDLFACDFASAIVPPFDSVFGSTASIISGEMNVANAGTADCYAIKNF